jgi:hypothetical protein
MKYRNKNTERLKDRMENATTVNKIVSSNKIKAPKSAIRSSKFNIGKIVNKTSEYDKSMEKIEDKIKPTEASNAVTTETPEQKDDVRVFNKGNMTYIKYKNKDIPISELEKLSKTDPTLIPLAKKYQSLNRRTLKVQ